MDAKQIAELPELKGTLLAEILKTLADGKFIDENTALDTDSGEKALGQMTDLEKAIFTVLENLRETYNNLANRLNGNGPAIADDAERKALRLELQKAEDRYNAVYRLFTVTVDERINPERKLENCAITIRSDFQIVSKPIPVHFVDIVLTPYGYSVVGKH